MTVAGRARLTALACLLGAAAPAGPARAAPAVPPRCAHLRLVAATDARPLLARVSDLLADDLPALDAAVAPAYSADRLFRLDDPDAACLTAWVVVEGPRAVVRVASAGRVRFVFRELAIEEPLSELDRERLAQVTRAALMALGEDAGALDRARALAASGVAPPAESRPPDVIVNAPRAVVPAPSFTLGAWYGVTMIRQRPWHGPGLTFALGGTQWFMDPQLWIDAQYVLPHSFVDTNVMIQTTTTRMGLSVGWERLRLGLGLGFDREAKTLTSADVPSAIEFAREWRPAARAFVRVVVVQRASLALSATLLVDAVDSPDTVYPIASDTSASLFLLGANTLRGGLALMLSWRS